MHTPDGLRVLLAHASALGALSAFLAEHDMIVDARAELPAVMDSRLDVIVVEECLLGRSPEAAKARLRDIARRVAVVVTGMSERALAEALCAGTSAVGYWSIDGRLEDLVDLVREGGHATFDRGVSPIPVLHAPDYLSLEVGASHAR